MNIGFRACIQLEIGANRQSHYNQTSQDNYLSRLKIPNQFGEGGGYLAKVFLDKI